MKNDMIVVGVGGAGCNVINYLDKNGKLSEMDTLAVNTADGALELTRAEKKILIGKSVCKGLGAGGRSEVGKRAAEEDIDLIEDALEDHKLAVIIFGAGGGTGTGAGGVIFRHAKGMGIDVAMLAIRPFSFEAANRRKNAENCFREFQEQEGTMLILDNDKLIDMVSAGTSMPETLEVLNEKIAAFFDRVNKELKAAGGHASCYAAMKQVRNC